MATSSRIGMRREFFVIAAVCLAVSIGQLAWAGGIGSTASSAGKGEYAELVARMKSGETQVDYRALREAYAASPGYDPYAMKVQAMIGMMVDAANAGDCDKALDLAKRITDIDFVQIDAHTVADFCYHQRKDAKRAAFHHAVALGLLRSIAASGDGKSPASAFVVVSMDEEYAMIHTLGLHVDQQALVNANGRSYDRLAVTTLDGRHLSIYFDVSRPFGSLERQFGGTKK